MLWPLPIIQATAEVILHYYLKLSFFKCGSGIKVYCLHMHGDNVNELFFLLITYLPPTLLSLLFVFHFAELSFLD